MMRRIGLSVGGSVMIQREKRQTAYEMLVEQRTDASGGVSSDERKKEKRPRR